MRTASVIRFLIPGALLVCVVVGIARVVPLPTTRHRLHVIEELELHQGDDIETYFSTGIDRLGGVSDGLSRQVQFVRNEAKKARDNLKNWTNQLVEDNKQKVVDYVAGLSDAADELENAESDFVGMCGTTAELLDSIGEELERKMATAESKRSQQDVADEQSLMRETIKYTAKHLEGIKGHFESAKTQFKRLAVTSEQLATDTENSVKELNATKGDVARDAILAKIGAVALCYSAPLPGCPASWYLYAAGDELNHALHKSMQALTKSASLFNGLVGICDHLVGRAQADIDQLTEVQIKVDAQKHRMCVKTIPFWKHIILPKNKKLVEKLKNVVSSYKNN